MREARRLALEFLGLKPWEFERLVSVHDFHALMRGEIHRRQVAEDLIGSLRLALYLVHGVKLDGTARPPSPAAPTFEKVMGREPVPFFPGPWRRGEAASPAEPEISDKAARAMAMINAAGIRKRRQGGRRRPPEGPGASRIDDQAAGHILTPPPTPRQSPEEGAP